MAELIQKDKRGMPVAQAIADLRAQLVAAAEDAQTKAIQFKVTSVELEMQLVLTTEISADGRLGWGVLSFGGGAKASDAQTHKLKLALEVRGAGGGPAPPISGPKGKRPGSQAAEELAEGPAASSRAGGSRKRPGG